MKSMPFVSHSIAATSIFAVCAMVGGAQISPSPGPAQNTHASKLTVNARLVVLDVVVTDKAGKPVDGLTRNDFQVFEDEQLQTVRSFEPSSAHHLPSSSVAAGISQAFDPANPASFGQTPVSVLVLDQLNTHFADSSFARQEIRKFLSAQPDLLPQPTELLGVSDSSFKEIHGFTRDRDALLKALAEAPTKYAWNLEIRGSTEYGPLDRLDQSLRALQSIAESSARVQGRKSVIWVGGGFPSIDPRDLKGKDNDVIKQDIRHVTDVLLDTRVTLYAVDPTTSAAGMTEITDESQQAFAFATGDSPTGSIGTFNATEAFDHLGPATGGKVIRGLNNVAEQIASAMNSSAQFYTLSYTPASTSQAEGRYRKIKVVCLRPELTVLARDGYFNESAEREDSPAAISYDLTSAAESSVPLNGLHVSVEPQHAGTADTQDYIVHVGTADLTWSAQDSSGSIAKVEILAVVQSPKGKMISHTLHGMTATAKPGVDLHDSSKKASFEFHLENKPRASRLRFVVRDAATGRMGSFDLPLASH